MNQNSLIIEMALTELENKTVSFTAQFLEVHQLAYENGRPVVVKVMESDKKGVSIVYFKVLDQKFYFVMYLKTENSFSILSTETHPYISISFKAHSTTLSLNELAGFSKLKYGFGKNKGDKKRPGSSVEWKESRVIYEPFLEPDLFERKLAFFLSYLETDKEGIEKLVSNANGYIAVSIEYYIGNTMLGGPTIKSYLLKRIASLSLDIDFDLYVSGEPFN
jgi:hypothetical protein